MKMCPGGMGKWVCVHKGQTLKLSFLTCCDLAGPAMTIKYSRIRKKRHILQMIIVGLGLLSTPSDKQPLCSPHTANLTHSKHQFDVISWLFLSMKATQVFV